MTSMTNLYYIYYEIPTELYRAFSIVIAYVAFNWSLFAYVSFGVFSLRYVVRISPATIIEFL
jgi:hypothetical protein